MHLLFLLLFAGQTPIPAQVVAQVRIQGPEFCDIDGAARNAIAERPVRLSRENCVAQVEKWRISVWDAVSLLPPSYFNQVQERYSSRTDGHSIKFNFLYFSERQEMRGYASDNGILLPIGDSAHGSIFTRLERTYNVLHELGHVYNPALEKYASAVRGESPPTEYGNKNEWEDFAESFAMYFTSFDQFQKDYPKRCRFIKKLLSRR